MTRSWRFLRRKSDEAISQSRTSRWRKRWKTTEGRWWQVWARKIETEFESFAGFHERNKARREEVCRAMLIERIFPEIEGTRKKTRTALGRMDLEKGIILEILQLFYLLTVKDQNQDQQQRSPSLFHWPIDKIISVKCMSVPAGDHKSADKEKESKPNW